MRDFKTAVSPLGLLVALAACGGSGGTIVDVTEDPLFIGSGPDAAESSNGLPFDEEGVGVIINNSDIGVPVLTAPVTAIRAPAEATVSRSTFNGDVFYFLTGEQDFDLDFEGETITFVDGSVILDDGRMLESTILEQQGGATLAAYAVETIDGYESISAFGFVQETAPADVAARMGVSGYTGPFRLLTASYVDKLFIEEGVQRGFEEIGTSLDGTATLIVDFGAGTLSGAISDIDFGGGVGGLSGTIAETEIVGNGALGTVTWACGNGATCADETELGMVIGRSDASTILGMTSIDTDITLADDEEVSITGVGGFIVER